MTSRGTNPGPHEYSVNESYFSKIKGAGTIGKSRNDSFIRSSSNPGPGNYRTETSMTGRKSPCAVIGTSTRYATA
jgi:hypothetical protein